MTLYTHQSQNVWKTWFIMFCFLAVVILLGWFISIYYQNPSILYIAVIGSVLMNIWSYWFSDSVVIRLTGARPVTKVENPELLNLVENLSITAGLPMPKVYMIDDPAPNAFATGRNKEHAVIAVTSGILKLLNKTELEGVIAHELSHVGNRDMLVSTVAVVLVGFVSIVSDIFVRSHIFGGGRGRREGGGNILMVVGIVFAVLSPLIAMLLQLAISRKREFLADASGALLTRYPEGLASALTKIGGYRRPMQRASTATAHLFIANPFGSGKSSTGFISKMLSTHPPMEDRVNALLGQKKE